MRILMPLPSTDFDPTESAVPWRVLTDHGHEVVFSTPDGKPHTADARMMSGRGLAIWRPILRAGARARTLYRSMAESEAFRAPLVWSETHAEDFDGIVLAGGHAPGMKPYLESPEVQAMALHCFTADKAVGAICHGVVVLARTVDPDTGKSVLFQRQTTALTQSMEMSAYWMTALWLRRYYRTYPDTVQTEVSAAAGGKQYFQEGPFAVLRDNPEKLRRGFVVQDRNYVSARWPGDAWRFATAFVAVL